VAVELELVTSVSAPVEAVFDLSLDVDVHRASMAGSHEEIVGGVRSGRMGLGDEVTWRARHLGISWTMTSRVTELDRPERFVDEQVRGPFASFRHEHRFAPDGAGTRMVDRLSFRAPGGPVGRLAEVALLRRYVRGLIEARNEHLRRVAAG
jgi:ligand-binding SRPBCC domain-containing protein